MSTKKAKVVAEGTGLELQSVPGESLSFKLTGDETGGALDYMIVTVAPKSGPPLHVHHTQEEVFHIIKGRFKFQAGDDTTICEQGDFAYIPAGTPHAFINLSDEAGEFIAVFTPGGTNKFFEEFGPMMNAEGGPPEQDVVAALLEKHGMTLLGPPLTAD